MKKNPLIEKIKYDCRHFDASKPCKPHKETGVFCDDCRYYTAVTTRVLIIKFGSIGDVLRTTSILPALRDKYPASHITWITAPNAREIFSNNSLVDRVSTDPSEYLPFIARVTFDVVINLETDLRSAALASQVKAEQWYGYTCNARGEVHPLNTEAEAWYVMGVNDAIKKANKETYFAHIFRVAGLTHSLEKPQIFLSGEEKNIAKSFAGKNNLSRFRKIIGINTGSGGRWQLKKWTKENYILLITLLLERNHDVGIILYGGPEEEEYNRSLMKTFSGKIADAGTGNSLRTFFALVNLADVYFTPDSLALHAATALEKAVVVYTGPTSYTELSVFGKGAVIHSDLDCLVCYLNVCDKKINCMNSLSIDMVYAALAKYF